MGQVCECRHLKTSHTDDDGPCNAAVPEGICACTVYRDDSGPELCEEHGIIKVACRACYEAAQPEKPVYPLTDAEIRATLDSIGSSHIGLGSFQAVASAQLKKVLIGVGNLETLTRVVTEEFIRQAQFGCSPSAEDIAIAVHENMTVGMCTKCKGLGWVPSLKYSSVCRNFVNDGTELGWALCACNGPMTVNIRPDQKPMPTYEPTRTGPWFPNG